MCCECGFMGDREWRFPGGLRLLLTEDFGEGEIKREREGGGQWGVPAITWDGSNHSWLISFVPGLLRFPSTSLSPPSIFLALLIQR